jgi:hypothetical protein
MEFGVCAWLLFWKSSDAVFFFFFWRTSVVVASQALDWFRRAQKSFRSVFGVRDKRIVPTINESNKRSTKNEKGITLRSFSARILLFACASRPTDCTRKKKAKV